MSEHKKFDDYIKGLFDENPKVPSDLNWEEMNFDLPIPEEKGKKSNKKYIGILLLFFFVTSIGFFGLMRNKLANTTPISSKAPTDLSSEIGGMTGIVEQSKINSKEFINQDRVASKEENLEKGFILSKNQTQLPAKSIAKEVEVKNFANQTSNQVPTKSVVKEGSVPKSIADSNESKLNDGFAITRVPVSNNHKGNSSNPETIISFSAKAMTDLNEESSQLYKRNEANKLNEPLVGNPMPNSEEVSGKKESPNRSGFNLIPEKGPAAEYLEPLSIVLSNNSATDLKPELSPPSPISEKTQKGTSNVEALFLGYGYNKFSLNIANSNPLKDKVESAFGNTFKIGIRLNLNQNWKTNVQLKLDRYHSTFEYARDLEPIYDLDSFSKYHRQEITFHNNYTNTIGLQLGVERRFKLNNSFDLYAGIGISPTYVLSASGKTLVDGQTIEDLVDDNQSDKFTINAGVNLGMIYNLNPSVSVELAYQYNRFLLGDIFINKDISTNQQNALSLILSYRLTK